VHDLYRGRLVTHINIHHICVNHFCTTYTIQVPGRRVVRHEAVQCGILKDLFDQVAKEASPLLSRLKQALVLAKELREKHEDNPSSDPSGTTDSEEASGESKNLWECISRSGYMEPAGSIQHQDLLAQELLVNPSLIQIF